MRSWIARAGRAPTSSPSRQLIDRIEPSISRRRRRNAGSGLAATRPRGQPLPDHAAARLPARLPGHARAGPVRRRAAVRGGDARATCSSSRRTSARPPPPWASADRDFRTWIVLHEATHAFEFEANAWLRPYLRDRLERQLAGVLDEARDAPGGRPGRPLRARRGEAQENPMAALPVARAARACSKRRSA